MATPVRDSNGNDKAAYAPPLKDSTTAVEPVPTVAGPVPFNYLRGWRLHVATIAYVSSCCSLVVLI